MAENREDPPLARDDAPADGREGGPVARPFTEDVFDDEYYGRRGVKARRGAPLGLAIGVVIGAAVAGGVAWFALREPSSGGAGSAAAPEVVKAESTPYKVKPENPGGMKVENADATVYERVAKGAPQRTTENLLPAPEKPKPPPKVADPSPPAPTAPPKVDGEVQGIVADMIKNMEAQQAASKAALPAGASVPEVVPSMAAPAPAPTPAAATPTAPAAPQPEPVVAAAPAAIPAAAPAPAPAPAPIAAQTAALPAGSFAIQLAAARSEQQAMGEWARVTGKHTDTLKGLTPSVIRADLGERGVFFRLRAGPLPDKAAADAVCETLKAANEACIVVRP